MAAGDDRFASRFRNRFTRPFPREPDANIQRFARAFEAHYDEMGDAVREAVESHFLFDASGADLDRIGARFGTLGRRRGRGDQEYRRYLASLIQTFRGRGTAEGIAFAVAAGVGADEIADVEIVDYPAQAKYGLRINSWAYHSGTDVRKLADLADAGGVSLLEPVEYVHGGAELGFSGGGIEVEATLDIDPLGFNDSEITFEREDGIHLDDGTTLDDGATL